jgi:hypothetical protein
MATFIGSADILLDPTQQLDQAEVVRSSGPGIKPQNQNIGDFAAPLCSLLLREFCARHSAVRVRHCHLHLFAIAVTGYRAVRKSDSIRAKLRHSKLAMQMP